MQFKNYVKKQIKVSTAWLLILAFVSTSFGLYHYSPAVRALIGGRNAGGAANFGAGRSVRQPTGPTTNLAAYYPLDGDAKNKVETTANNLTNVGTVTQTDTRQLAAQFTAASSESLSITDNAALSMTDIDFTISGWFYFDTMTTAGLIGKWNSDTSLAEYQLYYNGNGTSKFDFFVGYGGGAVASVSSSTTPTTSTWYFVVAWHDSVANTINIQVNNGATASTAHSNGVANGTNEFRIGRDQVTNYHNGRIDSVGVWKKALSANERTYLYNSGQGRIYSELAGYSGLSTSQVAWWELNEASSTRSDSVGSNNLTDNNTVTYATGVAGQATGNAASFDKSTTDRLDASSTSNLIYGGKNTSFTFAGWFFANTDPSAYHTVLAKYASDYPSAATNREYILGCELTNCNALAWGLYNSGGTGVSATKAISRGVWQFFVADYNVTTGVLSLDINNSGSAGTNTLSGTLSSSTDATFMIGGYGVGGTSYEWNGKLDEIATWSRLLTAQEKTALYNNGVGKTYQTIPSSLKNGLVSWWGFEEASSSTRNDYHRSNTDTPGVINGATLTSSGKFKQAYDFNGSSNYISVPSMTYGPQVSFSAWIKPDSLPTTSRIFGTCVDANSDCSGLDYGTFAIGVDGGKLTSSIAASNSGSRRTGATTTSVTLSTGVWQHVVSTIDTSTNTTTLYVNGQSKAVTTSIAGSGAQSFTGATYIGTMKNTFNNNALYYFDGLIDDIRIYNSVLTQDDVTQLYGGSPAPNCDQSCVGWWKLDETSGTSATDSSGNGNTGTYTGSPTLNAEGIYNGAMQNNAASTKYLNVGSSSTLVPSSDVFTFSAWVKFTSVSGYQFLIAKDASGARSFGWGFKDGGVFWAPGSSGGFCFTAPGTATTLSADQWYHVVFTSTKSGLTTVKSYINGKLDYSATGCNFVGADPGGAVSIGRRNYSGFEQALNGTIDDVRIYNRALTDYEIYDQYLAGRSN